MTRCETSVPAPPVVWVRENHLLEGTIGFFGERVFGPDRRDLLDQELRSFDGEPERKRQQHMRSLHRAIDEHTQAQAPLVLKFEGRRRPRGDSLSIDVVLATKEEFDDRPLTSQPL